MSRIFLHYIVPLLLPFVVYGVWLALARRRAGPAGARDWRDAPWTWLAIAGMGLLIMSLVGLALVSGSPPGGTYVPPQYIDGEIVPGRVE